MCLWHASLDCSDCRIVCSGMINFDAILSTMDFKRNCLFMLMLLPKSFEIKPITDPYTDAFCLNNKIHTLCTVWSAHVFLLQPSTVLTHYPYSFDMATKILVGSTWWHQVITYTNVDSRSLAATSVQFQRECAKRVVNNYYHFFFNSIAQLMCNFILTPCVYGFEWNIYAFLKSEWYISSICLLETDM